MSGVERAEELLRAGRVGAGLRELERERRRLLAERDAAGLAELADRAEVTPEPKFRALAYAARQNVRQVERLEALGETRSRHERTLLVAALLATVLVVGGYAGLMVWGFLSDSASDPANFTQYRLVNDTGRTLTVRCAGCGNARLLPGDVLRNVQLSHGDGDDLITWTGEGTAPSGCVVVHPHRDWSGLRDKSAQIVVRLSSGDTCPLQGV